MKISGSNAAVLMGAFACLGVLSPSGADNDVDGAVRLLPERVAVVGTEFISGEEFQRDLEYRTLQMAQRRRRMPTVNEAFVRQTLQHLIDGRILRQLARSSGISVSSEEVDTEFQLRRSALNPDGGYEAYLERSELSEARLLEGIRDRLLTERFVEAKAGTLSASEEELKALYEQWAGEGRLLRRVRTYDVAHIMIRADGAAEAAWEHARKEAEAARARLLGGAPFEDLAHELSDDVGSATSGGVYYECVPGRVPEVIGAHMALLPVGEISEPLQGPVGWHLLKVLSRNNPGAIDFEKARPLLKNELLERKRGQAAARLVRDAKNLIRIEVFDVSAFVRENGVNAALAPTAAGDP